MSNNVLYFLFMPQLGGVLLCHRGPLIALLKYCVQAEGEALVWGFMSLHLRLKSGDLDNFNESQKEILTFFTIWF